MKRIGAVIIALLISTMPSANAHTALISASPKNNAMLTKSPAAITLTFSEDLLVIDKKSGNRISLTTAKGLKIALPEPTTTKRVLTVKLPKLNPDKYKVSFRAVASDGHPVSGSYFFWVH